MAHTPLIDEEVPVDGTASGTVERGHPDNSTRFAFFVDPEETGVTLELTFYGRHRGGGDMLRIEGERVRKEDINEGRIIQPDTRGSKRVEIRVLNDGNAPVNLKVWAQEYHV